MTRIRQGILAFATCVAAALAAETVIDPGAGGAVNAGVLSGKTNVEVRSGIVSATMAPSFGGRLRVTGGTFSLDGFGEGPNPEALRVRALWTGSETAAPLPFTVRKNEEFKWFDVEPASGVLSPGQTDMVFTVHLKTELMTNRRFYRGVFFVTATNGLSRPVSVNVETDFIPPFHAEKPGEIAIYADLESPVSGSPREGEAEYAFNVPAAGTYYFMVHCAANGKVNILAAVDGDEYEISVQQTKPYPTWTMLTPGREFGDYLRPYVLSAGRHTVRIKIDYVKFPYDGLVLTDSPGSFEPR